MSRTRIVRLAATSVSTLFLAVACSGESSSSPAEPEVTATTEPVAVITDTPDSTTETMIDVGSITDPLGCDGMLAAFEPHESLVSASCGSEYLLIASDTGLSDPDPGLQSQRMMVGIENWILRVPVPFEYNWRILLEPVSSADIIEASPRGPIAVAADGVPIFHYEAWPDVSAHPEHYDPGSATVVQGELDHCGGHAGQGDDYHYHYAPVCLFDVHDLAEPVAYGLDGAPVYVGTGGSDFYGDGRYNAIDNLPDQDLDLCNAIEDGHGGYVHYTTSEPPYVIGCHHGVVDSGLQIEPRPMRPQGDPGPYGGVVGEPISTLVTDWFVDSGGWMHLEHESFDGEGTSAVLY